MAKQIIITQNDYGIPIRVDIEFDDSAITLADKNVSGDIVAPDNTKTPVAFQILDNTTTEYILLPEDTNQVGLYTIYVSVLDEHSKITAQKTVTYYCMAEDGGVA